MSQITEQELSKLSSVTSQEQWDAVCDEIKASHNGYPSDWWAKVKLSGLGDRVAKSFGESFDYKVKRLSL